MGKTDIILVLLTHNKISRELLDDAASSPTGADPSEREAKKGGHTKVAELLNWGK